MRTFSGRYPWQAKEASPPRFSFMIALPGTEWWEPMKRLGSIWAPLAGRPRPIHTLPLGHPLWGFRKDFGHGKLSKARKGVYRGFYLKCIKRLIRTTKNVLEIVPMKKFETETSLKWIYVMLTNSGDPNSKNPAQRDVIAAKQYQWEVGLRDVCTLDSGFDFCSTLVQL